ncbi:MAG TPA: hypothetical protein VLH77_05835 [Gammaproteobacteria bacterium]|nr:hypothetical protein [Gammaproteobacteria bacterium]
MLYSHKSVPPEPNEPGKLYISYLDDPSAVMLLGKSKDHKPIKRKLNIHSKRASSLITITSEHVDFATGKSFTCTGVGHDFESALDHYFSSSRLDKQDICKTNQNVEKKGDAFLLQKAINKKGNESWVEDIIKAVGKLFQLLPPEKHPPVVALIEKGIERLDQFIKENGNQSIANFYDPRLWLIVESICKHFDPLTGENASQRKEYRDYLIANSCSKLMQEEDITSSLDSYFQAMSMHQEIMETEKINNLTEVLKVLLDAYRKDNLYPEVEGHREKIKDYYERCKRHKNKADPERSEGSHSTP